MEDHQTQLEFVPVIELGVLLEFISELLVDAFGYNVLIHGFCNEMKLQDAENVQNEMRKHVVGRNEYSYRKLIRAYCQKGWVLTAKVVDYFQWFTDPGMFLDEVLYNIVIDDCCDLDEMQMAVELFDEMKERRMIHDAIHYTCLIYGYCCQRELKSALGALQEMKEIGVKPDIVTYKGLCRGGMMKEAREILDALENKCVLTCSAMVNR